MCRLAICAASALALMAAATPAAAFTLSGSYYEDSASNTCNSSSCDIAIPLPAALTGSLLTLIDVGCIGFARKPLNQIGLLIADSPAGTNLRRSRPLNVPSQSALGNFSFSQQITYKITGGPPRHILVRLSQEGSDAISASCAISGAVSAQ